jgi:uncharacterized protein YfdQ (DUF2303 family)
MEKPTQLIDITALLAAGAGTAPVKHEPGYTPLVLVPDGYTAKPLEHEKPKPLKEFIDQRVTLSTLESFAAYVKRYQSSTTVILAEVSDTGATFTAVFDYHQAAKDATIAPTCATGVANVDLTQANRLAHRAIYKCPRSFEWQQWHGNNARAMDQEKFAAFIEANVPDITDPTSGTLLEMVLNFEMKSNVDFKSNIVRQNGARTLTFNETIEATGGTTAGSIKVPEEIGLKLPIFHGGKPYEFRAKLYYKAPGGKLQISYELKRPHEQLQAAIKDVMADIATETNITPLAGRLEE